MRVLIVGDLHRKWKYLQKIHQFYKYNNYDKLVLLGDLADDFVGNYEDTLKIWDLVKKYQKNDENVICVMGNHDFVYAYADELYSKYGRYDVQSGFDFSTLYIMGDERMKFLKSLPFNITIDRVTYSHAGMSHEFINRQKAYNIIDNYWNDYSPLWQRPSRAHSTSPYRVINQVFGHTPQKTCTNIHLLDNCWCIDTFSTYRDGSQYGDRSILEVVDGKQFNVIREKIWNKSIYSS